MRRLLMLFVTTLLLMLPLVVAAAEDKPEGEKPVEKVYIVSGYQYEPGAPEEKSDVGQSLCGTRCNAMSVDYLNYTGPGGWRLIKIADKKKVSVDLNNPYLSGKCTCIADEYKLVEHKLYLSLNPKKVKEATE